VPLEFLAADGCASKERKTNQMKAQNQHHLEARSLITNQLTDLPHRARSVWRAAICLLALAASLHWAQGATSVCGPVTGTWTSNNSPYLVTCDVQVYALTIQPGVEVRVQGPYVLEVVTWLQAQGASNAPIVFTNETSVAGWKGIYFNNSLASSLTYCHIHGSTNTAVRIVNSSPTLTACLISRNSGPSPGGGGVYVNGGTALIDHCSVSNNSASVGVGLYLAAGHCQVTSTVIKNNNSPTGSGGGVYHSGGSATFRNSLITSNSAPGLGAGMYINYGPSVSIVNCTLVGNTGGQGIYVSSGSLPVTNSIIWFNNVSGNFTFDHCDVQGGVQPGTGNISVNPGLCQNNPSLGPGSPCIDAGNPDPAYYDKCTSEELCSPYARGTYLNDMGAYGGPGAGPCPCIQIVVQPHPQSSCLGQNATFTVGATGDPPLAYQWYKDSTPLSGKTDWQLVLTNLQGTNAGLYQVRVTNSCGSVWSEPAQLIVNDACIDICMIAGLTISGQSGSTYVLKYTTDVANTNFDTWTPLATNTLNGGPWYYADWGSCGEPRRFYSAKLVP
jgi:hypothetical protein